MRRPFLALCFSMAMGAVLAEYADLKFWQLCLFAGTAAFLVLFFSDRVFCNRKNPGKRNFGQLNFGKKNLGKGNLGQMNRKGHYLKKHFPVMGRSEQGVRIHRAAGWNFCRTFLCCVVFFLMGFCRMKLEKAADGQFSDADGKVVTAEAVVVTAVPKEKYAAVTVACGGERVLLRLDTTSEDYVYRLPGRKVLFTGKISLPEGRRNPGCFDYARYLKGKGIRVICQVSAFRLSAGPVVRPMRNYLSVLKGDFFAKIKTVMDEESFSVLAALVFGAKNYMDEEFYKTFQNNGIAHILAVSGLHVGMLYGLTEKLTGGRKDGKVMVVTGGLLLCYAALADFSVSVLRAALMIALRLAALPLRRRYDMVSAASAAAMIFLIARPYQLFDSGFQLSFMAAYTMGVCVPWMKGKIYGLADRKRKTWIRTLGDAAGSGLMIQVVMLPLTLYHFLTFSPLALILNPAAIFLAGLLLAAGLAAFGVSFVVSGLGVLNGVGAAVGLGVLDGFSGSLLMAAAAGPAQFLCRALALLSRAGARACGGFAAAAPPLAAVLLWYLLLFFFFSETRYILVRSGKGAASVKAAVVLAVLGCSVPYQLNITNSLLPWKYNDYPIVFLDVGQGDCCHIRVPAEKNGGIFSLKRDLNILIDGGGTWGSDIAEQTLEPYLLKNGVKKIDLAIVTHKDQDHAKGIQQLSQRMEIGAIAFPACYESLVRSGTLQVQISEAFFPVSAVTMNSSAYLTSSLLFLRAGDQLSLGPDADLNILAPAATLPNPDSAATPLDATPLDATPLDAASTNTAQAVLAPAAGSIASGDENDNCLVMVFRYKDLTVFFAADMTAAGETALLQTAYGNSHYGQSPYGQSPYGQSPYGQSPYSESLYGQSLGSELQDTSDFLSESLPQSQTDSPGDSGTRENPGCQAEITSQEVSDQLPQSATPTVSDRQKKTEPALAADILKMSHHGSGGSSSDDFVSAVNPAFAVISCGKNNSYGHPAKRVVDLLQNSDIIYGRTDRSGALCLRSFGPRFILFENAAKDTRWLIPRKQKLQENTPPEP